ncbi:MAG: UDP-3-O-[3-hydroxymyristoyl] N-acetylglucosamine deacetylase [Aquificae bacterium]|nr:UDP-3-O-[3-hydroxymyristoyl] N-acetylglucosamine deacetylase [Aquificota bacterium]
MELRSKTLAGKVTFRGVGIHTGEVSKLTLHPSEDKGIFFYRKGELLPALHPFVVNAVASTDLAKGNFLVKTVEHLTAALYLLGVDSVLIEVEYGSEVPILDGGAKTFVEEVLSVGLRETGRRQTLLRVKEKVRVQPNGNFIEVLPFEGELFEYEGEFPFVGRKRAVFDGKPTEALLGARTFCRLEDFPLLWANRLGLGGYPVNTLALDESLRYLVYSEEPAYHKLLDLIGDLALLGGRLVGRVYSFKGNHLLNHQLREVLLKGGYLEREEAGASRGREPLRPSASGTAS